MTAKRLPVVPLAVARLALDPHVGQKVHLDALLPVPLAVVAAASRPIEAEPGRLVSADPRLRQAGEKLADRIEDARVSRRVRRGRVPQRLLVDDDHLVDLFESANLGVRTGRFGRTVQSLRDGPRQRVFDQRAFPRAGHARDAGEGPQRQPQIDVVQIVLPRAEQLDPASAGRHVASPPAFMRRVLGIGISLRPERYCPVSEAEARASSFGVPCAVIVPPKRPAPGPKS